jgi:hypothetical protein
MTIGVADIESPRERLRGLGLVRRTPPSKTGPVTIAWFDYTRGNLAQVAQH